MIQTPVCRLAPSPTGAQHLGNARTFLIAYWSARSQNARLILRIEDIDSPRVKPWATQQAMDDLSWLGIEHDGEPTIQTELVDRYEDVLRRMIQDDQIYPCVCSRKDIDQAASAPHEHSLSAAELAGSIDTEQNSSASLDKTRISSVKAETTIYPGTCATWRSGDPLPAAGDYCLRFRINDSPMVLMDRVAGEIHCTPATVLGDFPVTRKEGVAAYQLAVVVDDVEAGVNEVVRGDDLIASAFRQLQIYGYLNASPPVYAHVPLVVGEDGRRLAKRHGDTRLSEYRSKGVSPNLIVAWAAQSAFGHLDDFPNRSTQDWSIERWHREMIERFDWKNMSRQRIVVPDRNDDLFQ